MTRFLIILLVVIVFLVLFVSLYALGLLNIARTQRKRDQVEETHPDQTDYKEN